MFLGWGQDGRSERFKCEAQSTIDTYKDEWNHKPRNAGDIKGIKEAPRQQLARKWDPSPTTGAGFCQQPKNAGKEILSQSIQMRPQTANALILALEDMKQRNQLCPPGFTGKQ